MYVYVFGGRSYRPVEFMLIVPFEVAAIRLPWTIVDWGVGGGGEGAGGGFGVRVSGTGLFVFSVFFSPRCLVIAALGMTGT